MIKDSPRLSDTPTPAHGQSPRTEGRWIYRPPDGGHWDEALDAAGRLRPQWRRLAVALRHMGYEEFSRRWEDGQRLIRANGVTYNVYGDPRGNARPWPMDLVPLVVDAAEWAQIERGVVQRAILLNAILADLYGPQRLLRSGQLPPELVYANPGFLRPCHGITPSGGVYLQNFAVDIARAPNGMWWVIADRTQVPSGSGYALENRHVSARTLPTLLQHCHVRPLAPFFERTIQALLDLAPRKSSSPRVVVLSAGPHSEAYFEHSFFARHWDFPLVGGADLTVRDGRVFLKTLAGLNPVDVILRRQDDDFCDPVSLRGDSLLGVPGLVDAARAGNVFIANSLGSGLTEAPALMAFLPGLCRHVLGEPLKMPSVATWWCGQEGPRRQVLANLERVVVKPTFPRAGQHSEFPAAMTADERATLAARLEADPARFVAQEQVDLSTTPVHTHRGLEARHVVLRVLAAWDGTSYAVLPGGLTRVATGRQSVAVSIQRGGGSKDTWVLGTGPSWAPEPDHAPPASYVTTSELSSRVADSLFWLGRYAERLESVSRLLRVLLAGVSENPDSRRASGESVFHFVHGLDLLPPGADSRSMARQWWTLQRWLTDLAFDTDHTASVGWNLQHVRRLGWEVKERLSPDSWRVVQHLETIASAAAPSNHDRRYSQALARLDDIVIMLSAFSGLLAEHPTRGHGWRFLAMGRRVERALQMLDLLRVGVARAPFPDDEHLELLLQVADSATTYRSRYLASIRTDYVLELLLADASNPRSVAFQLEALAERAEKLPPLEDGGDTPLEFVIASHLRQQIRHMNGDDLKRRNTAGGRPTLETLLSAIRLGVSDLSAALTARYLIHSAPAPLRSSF